MENAICRTISTAINRRVDNYFLTVTYNFLQIISSKNIANTNVVKFFT